MDSINFYDIKAEKANAIMKYRQRRKIAKLFRLIEVLAVLLLLSRFSVQLPHAVKNSASYFKDISGFMVSPRFVFVVGNVIVIILYAKSGRFSAKDSSIDSSGGDLYEEFVQNSEKNQKLRGDGIEYPAIKKRPEDSIVSEQAPHSSEAKKFTRSRSEIVERTICKSSRRLLKRSETEKLKENVQSGGKLAGSVYPEDGMSNEEFRSKVESFIARQQKFRLQEEFSVN
ncbi:hypothetical protein D8674_026145 [Pyrus ussuriensis x Pyrus communis]|uniref:DUF4408 domain-containing protein n=1 Tax=Pyrus ussuriensis x Pyrus communis TaxID=2448454 RepID=A0A5N5IAL9_9ROSA|nr:uncharacterized protein LOC103937446 [Pyrus x bretschneideri]KAB2634614.1 hypothetical protein D8674_038089 [Pyrus ussuriensis x Pyrus communis]KAB2635611.1 hypothetical protein D8674_026145 [Pyrus ussuriensis x Pyrus communis]